MKLIGTSKSHQCIEACWMPTALLPSPSSMVLWLLMHLTIAEREMQSVVEATHLLNLYMSMMIINKTLLPRKNATECIDHSYGSLKLQREKRKDLCALIWRLLRSSMKIIMTITHSKPFMLKMEKGGRRLFWWSPKRRRRACRVKKKFRGCRSSFHHSNEASNDLHATNPEEEEDRNCWYLMMNAWWRCWHAYCFICVIISSKATKGLIFKNSSNICTKHIYFSPLFSFV